MTLSIGGVSGREYFRESLAWMLPDVTDEADLFTGDILDRGLGFGLTGDWLDPLVSGFCLISSADVIFLSSLAVELPAAEKYLMLVGVMASEGVPARSSGGP